jgi:hypothetical protein
MMSMESSLVGDEEHDSHVYDEDLEQDEEEEEEA